MFNYVQVLILNIVLEKESKPKCNPYTEIAVIMVRYEE